MSSTSDGSQDRQDNAEDARKSDAQDRPLSCDEKLEEGLEDSMDASDPPSSTRPHDKGRSGPILPVLKRSDDEVALAMIV